MGEQELCHQGCDHATHQEAVGLTVTTVVLQLAGESYVVPTLARVVALLGWRERQTRDLRAERTLLVVEMEVEETFSSHSWQR